MDDILWNLPNVVELSDPQWHIGSFLLMVSYGAHFAFILYFALSTFQLAPRYRIVTILSAVVMASAGLSLFREWSMWNAAYEFSTASGTWLPLQEGQTFSNVYRYGNWIITVPILLTQLVLAFGLPRREGHKRATRMSIAALLMIVTGLVGQFGDVNDFTLLNIWGVISTLFFVWLIIEVRATTGAGAFHSPDPVKAWPGKLFWYFLFTWGLYPIAYAVPQIRGLLGDGNTVLVQQAVFTVADVSSKLIYGVILSRYCLRRSALEGEPGAVTAFGRYP